MEKDDVSSEESMYNPPTPTDDQFLLRNPFHSPQSPICMHECYSLQSEDFLDISSYDSEQMERLVEVEKRILDPVVARRELARMVILHEYPLSMVDHIGFRKFSSYLNPSFGMHMVSRDTVRKDIMKAFEFEKNYARALVGGTSCGLAARVSIWSSSDTKRRSLAITAYWIANNWDKEFFIMRFANVEFPFTNESLVTILVEWLLEFYVGKQLTTITFDTCIGDDELTNVLVNKLSLSDNRLLLGGRLLQIPCFARTLSVIVKDGFDVVDHVINKIRDSIIFWTAMPHREKRFDRAIRLWGVDNRRELVLDNESMWNSTYLMLQEAILYKLVFYHLREKESQFTCMPTEEEWELVEEVCQKLKLLYDVMKVLSKRPEVNVYFLNLCEIKVAISEWLEHEDKMVKAMASRMSEKFDRYLSAVFDIVGVAFVLDPRHKLRKLEELVKKIYTDTSQREVERVRQTCYDLFYQYSSSRQQRANNTNTKKRKEREECELDVYLEEDVLGISKTKHFNILSWWEKEKKYPTLQNIARDVLAIPVCSVAPEHVFHVGDRVLGPQYSRLRPTMVEALVCAQGWLKEYSKFKDLDSSSATRTYSLGTIYDNAIAENEIQDLERAVSLNR